MELSIQLGKDKPSDENPEKKKRLNCNKWKSTKNPTSDKSHKKRKRRIHKPFSYFHSERSNKEKPTSGARQKRDQKRERELKKITRTRS